ncbi:HPP family protein [bacterium]|nr:HPP family protein [bacterium]
MIPTIQKIKQEFRLYWKHYVIQSLLATLSMTLVLLFLTFQNAVVVASIGATSFIIFAMPDDITAKPRNVIGGHVVGLLIGSLCGFIPHSYMLFSIFIYSLAVGVSIFIMVVIDMEHPPASGTALGVSMTGFSLQVLIAVLTSIIVLSLIHNRFRSKIRNLV